VNTTQNKGKVNHGVNAYGRLKLLIITYLITIYIIPSHLFVLVDTKCWTLISGVMT